MTITTTASRHDPDPGSRDYLPWQAWELDLLHQPISWNDIGARTGRTPRSCMKAAKYRSIKVVRPRSIDPRSWAEWEIDLARGPWPDAVVARKTRRTTKAVNHFRWSLRRKMGLTRIHAAWTAPDDEIVVGSLSYAQKARKLGRTRNAVAGRINRLRKKKAHETNGRGSANDNEQRTEGGSEAELRYSWRIGSG